MDLPLPRFERLPCPTVLLRHALPGGVSHIDWMIAREPDGAQALISFRTDRPLYEVAAGQRTAAQRIGDHRPHYLDYEGTVSGNRGEVARLARGEICEAAREERDGVINMLVRWRTCDGREIDQRLKLVHENADQWAVSCITLSKAPAAAGAAKEES